MSDATRGAADELRARRDAHEAALPDCAWYSVTDLARRWHLSTTTVRGIPRTDLPYKEFGNRTLKRRRYRSDWIKAYEEATGHEAAA